MIIHTIALKTITHAYVTLEQGDEKVGEEGGDEEKSWWERRSKYGPGIEGGGAVGLLLCSLTLYTFTQSFLRTQTGKKVRTKRFRRGGGGGEKARTL